MADLCLSRNYIAINPLESVFPLSLCESIISKEEFNEEMRHCFTRLIIHLWVDRSPYMKINLPNRIRVWTELEDNPDKIISTDKSISQFETLKIFVCDYMKNIKESRYQKAYENAKNKLTEAILRLAK